MFRRPRTEDEDELAQPDAHAQSGRPLPLHEQRLMFEASTHWGRGLAIVLGMIATVLVFLVVLTLIPKPGNGNPLDSLTSSSSNTSAGTPGAAKAAAAGAQPSLATVGARTGPGPGATGTPGARWVAVAARGAPNVRSAPNTNNNPIGNLAPGRSVEVIGISPDKAWLQIVWDNNTKAWVAQDLMQVTQGDPNQIPVVR